jgi:glycosyltransferase involved in cell wall biosynthesis
MNPKRPVPVTVRSPDPATIRDVTDGSVLSVVLPVRNAAPFIADALVSLQRNAEPGFEFVVVDDGSTDGTTEIIDGFRAELPGLRVVRHETAVGLADARNAGLAVAQGRYVTYLDGDDWLAPGYLAPLVAAIEELQCEFVRVDHVQVEGRKRVLHRAPEGRRGVVLDPRSGILPSTVRTMVDYPYAWAGIYRRDLGALLDFPGKLHTAEDRPWIWRLHLEARSYAVVSLAGLFYRRLVSTSLTQIGDTRQLQFLDAYELVFAQVAGDAEVQAKAVRQFLAVLAHHLTLSRRVTPSARRQLTRRARALLAELPPEALRANLPTDARFDVLRPLLPSAHRLGSASA